MASVSRGSPEDSPSKQAVIDSVHSERVDLARVLKKHTGIRRIVEELYPDSAHFIFELLQNAEDTGASEVSFALEEDCLSFEHNGRPFAEADILAITDVGEGTKFDDVDTIGRFGVGFKAVFAYTETPRIWSPTYSFEISELVLPSLIGDRIDLDSRTRFEFPFNNPKKPRSIAFKEVEEGLLALAETTLLFLSNIHAINWRVDGGQDGAILRIEHSDEHVEVLKESRGETTATSHFLRFSETVECLERQKVSLAFSLELLKKGKRYQPDEPLAAQFKIVPVIGQVAVFFPAEKETSGLRFHLHAPFVPELSRASIKATPANAPLFEQLASLSVAALHGVKALGFLTPDFLGVLPNQSDQLGERYTTIRKKITEAFNDEPLTPTFSKGHAPARHLLQAKASLKELLGQEDIEFLVDYTTTAPQWAASRALQGTPVEKFMSGLAIKDWDVDDFLEELSSKLDATYSFSPPDAAFLKWLSSKPADWMQQLYAMLASEPETKDELNQLSAAKIVRLMDGSLSVPNECYFPDDHGRYSKIVPCVDREVLDGGSSQKRKKFSKAFLSEIGVTEIGERQLVEALLDKNYASAEHTLKEKEHVAHLRRFMKLLEKEPSARSILQEHRIFLGDDMQWHKPGDIYLDSPYLDTGMSEYYEVLGLSSKTVQLHSLYQNLPIDTSKIASLAEKLGAKRSIPVKKSSCTNNPDWSYLCRVPGERNTSPINDDYVMIGFERLVSRKSIRVSRLIWNTMNQLGAKYLEARFRRNVSGGSRYAQSQLVHQLRNTAWVPQGDTFAKPSAARAGLLPEGFGFDAGSPWIKAIDFGGDVVRESEEARAQAAAAQARKSKREAAAAELGFDNPDDLEWLAELSELSEDERLEMREEMRRRKSAPDLPENEPSNPERRDARVREIAKDAQERETEKRSRSVSIGQGAVKEEAKEYLQHQYTGDDGLFCQVCEKPMPFVLDDGSPYFEAVEFLQEKELKKRHHQNYLALCPNHAAMFRHANGSKDIMKAMLLDLDDARLEVVLAQADCTIYFTKTHLADLKSAIHAEDEDESEDLRASSG